MNSHMLMLCFWWVITAGLEDMNNNMIKSTSLVNFTVTTKPFSILVMRKNVNSTDTYFRFGGLCFDILNMISEKYNMVYDFGPVDEDVSGFGSLSENGTWTGMVAAVLDGDADIAINEFTMSPQRSAVVDFSAPFRRSNLVLVLKNPDQNDILLTRPFEYEVWLYRIVIFVCFTISVLFISRWSFSNQSQTPAVQLVLHIFSGQFIQGMDDSIIRKSYHLQFAFIGWLIGSFFLAVAYTSNLAAIFCVEKQPMRAESLVDALAVPEFELIIGKDSYEQDMFADGKTQVYREVWKRITASEDNMMTDDDLLNRGYETVARDDHMGLIFTEIESIIRLSLKKNQQLYIAKEPLTTIYSHFIWRKSFPYANVFNREIQRLTETGEK